MRVIIVNLYDHSPLIPSPYNIQTKLMDIQDLCSPMQLYKGTKNKWTHPNTHHAPLNTLSHSLIIIYFSSPSMYEKNFWYLFDVKKLTSLNYDKFKKYCVNLKSF
jgi:hypothetical protein